ncbi:MAG: AAA family ATPase [Planctomycetes bacterium]|nr:AAA family ATPase [Planctomycetota bacterium]
MTTVSPSRAPLPRTPDPRIRTAPSATVVHTLDPFRVLRRHLVLIIGTAVAGTVLGVVAFFLLNKFSPLYTAEALFEIRAGLEEGSDTTTRDINDEDTVVRLATTEMYLIVSREVLDDAVKDPSVLETKWFNENFLGEYDEAVDELQEDLRTALIPGSYLFRIKWSARYAADVPIILTAVTNAYINKRSNLDKITFNQSLDVFKSQLTEISRNLDDLGQLIETFIREKSITNIDDPRANQLAITVTELALQIAEDESMYSLLVSSRDQTSAKLEGTIMPTEEDRKLAEFDFAVRAHDQGIIDTKTALRELKEKYRDYDHPMILKAQSSLRALEAEYEAKIKETMTSNLQAELKTYNNQITNLDNMLEQFTEEYKNGEAQLRELAADMSKYRSMEDRRDLLEAQRDAIVQNINQVQMLQLRTDARRVRLALAALEPRERSFPKFELVVPFTAILLLGTVVGLIFLREMTDQRVKSAADIEMVPSAKVLGVIPDLVEDPCKSEEAELVVRRCPNSVLAESFRQASGLIQKGMNRSAHQTLLILGGLPEAGTTSVITNLAATAMASGLKVVVVDANFRRPRLAQAMGVSGDGPGLGDLLIKANTLKDTIINTEYGIDVIPAGTAANRVFERLSNGQVDSILAELRNQYDVIFIDAPPAVVAGDAMVLANKVDAAVLVVRAYREQRGLIARLVHQLNDAQCELLGVVLNRPRGTAGGYFKKNYAVMASYGSGASS